MDPNAVFRISLNVASVCPCSCALILLLFFLIPILGVLFSYSVGRNFKLSSQNDYSLDCAPLGSICTTSNKTFCMINVVLKSVFLRAWKRAWWANDACRGVRFTNIISSIRRKFNRSHDRECGLQRVKLYDSATQTNSTNCVILIRTKKALEANFCLIKIKSQFHGILKCLYFSQTDKNWFKKWKPYLCRQPFAIDRKTRFTREEIFPDLSRIRNVLVPDSFCCLHTGGRIRKKTFRFSRVSGDFDSGI